MATKVMHATALAQRRADSDEAQPRGAPGPAAGKPKRRRSSVYDADGNEVYITLMCLKCHQMRPLSQFGLRRMADGVIRNQPWCRPCRAGAAGDAPRRKRGSSRRSVEDPSVSGESSAAEASAEAIVDPGTLAAQVVAALNGGRR